MTFRSLFAVVVAVGAWHTVFGAEPIDIGSRLELFVDDYLLERMSGDAELRLHRPIERERVFVHNTPWEGNRSLYHTVFQDGDLYKMYYRGSQIDLPDSGGISIPYDVICYAESGDGIHWRRPELGLIEFEGSKKNNIILSGELANQSFVPFRDANPDCRPEEQYKALAVLSEPAKGLYAFASPDGIHWKPMSDKPVVTEGYFDSQNLAFWDTVRKCYVDFHRALRGGPESIRPPTHVGSTKDMMTATSKDFINWTEPVWLEYAPERWLKFSPRQTKWSPFVQFYTNQIVPYYRAPHIYLGFPARYAAGRDPLTPLNERLSRSQEYFGRDYSDTGLITSRDGRYFRVWPEAFIRPGLVQKGRWVYADNYQNWGIVETESDWSPGSDGPQEGGGPPPRELSIYVSEGVWRRAGLRRYTLRIDGFVSVNASLRGGEFVTRPIRFQGDELVMNLSTAAVGSIRVEIQTAEGRPMKGFRLEDCSEIFGDHIERVVSWKDRTNVGHLAGKPIRLRFVLRDADLYSFRFRD
jgi:hypothetical protein